MEPKKFAIDTKEKFPHLPGAPIVEAIIDLKSKTEEAWEEESLRATLEAKLGGYLFLDSQKESRINLLLKGGQPLQQEIQGLEWKGLRFRSTDGRRIAQFGRDGFTFRVLPPYEDWEKFQTETLKLWAMHLELSKSNHMQRVGLRFINRIEIDPTRPQVGEYISGGPVAPKGLPSVFQTFIHRDTWDVRPYAYALNVIRTLQRLPNEAMALILDIDVSTTEPFELQPNLLESKLAEMRWLKNKAFFGTVSDKLLEKLKKTK